MGPLKTIRDLELHLGLLILRELENFRDSAAMPAKQNTATEVAQHDHPPQSSTGQDSTAANMAEANSAATVGEEDKQPPPAVHQPQSVTALLDADEAANGFHGAPVKLLTLRGATEAQRRNNAARQQRVYRLAHKIGVSPGGERWVRGGRPYMQPAVPRSVLRGDGSVEYNQFMYDGEGGQVVLRMPGGWRRDLVRNRGAFLGVVVIDGFLWPRFDSRLPRGMMVDWGELPPLVPCCLDGS